MFNRNGLSCALLVLSVSAPVLAQEAKPSPAAADVIQDPMPHSRAPGSAQSGPAQAPTPPTPPKQTQAPQPGTRPAAPVGHTEQKEAPTLAFSINPATLLFGSFGAEIEGAVAPSISLFAAPSYVFGSSVFTPSTGVSLSGFGIDAGARFFTGSQAPKGFWIGPYLGLAFVTASAGKTEVSATGIAGGGMLGYSWIFDSSFYFSLGVGGGYQSVSTSSASGAVTASTSGPALTLRLALGFAK